MRCPYCGDEANKVIDSRLGRDLNEVRRRRECLECGQRFTTRERVESALPRIVKRDGRSEDYDRRKLVGGIARAFVKRPMSAERIERLADRIERWLTERGEPEVVSAELGKHVLQELCVLDAIAAARFASVFLRFESADDYARFFASLPDDTPRPDVAPDATDEPRRS